MTTKKVAFITGAGKGIGLETARGLGLKGIHVILGVRKKEQGEAALATLRKAGIATDLIQFDVAEGTDHQKVFDHISKTFGKIGHSG